MFCQHPGYDNQLLGKNDVALLILAKPYKRTRLVKAISLPNFRQSFNGNKNCYATGFGLQGQGRPYYIKSYSHLFSFLEICDVSLPMTSGGG